jgi:hypothetical protein
MATPQVTTDGVSGFEAAVLNKYLAVGEANKPTCKAWFARVRFNGSSWEVHGSTESAGLSSGGLAWNGASSQLEITLTGFSAAPVVLASPMCADAALAPKAHAQSQAQALIAWFDAAGARVTTESTAMDACVLIVGA